MVMESMDQNLERQEWILNYLDGNLAEDERIQFEKQLAVDTGLQQELSFMRIMMASIDQWGNSTLEESVRQVQSKLDSNGFFNGPGNNRKRKTFLANFGKTKIWMAVAASVTILVVAAYLLWPETKSVSKQVSIYKKYYQREIAVTDRLIQRFESDGLIPGNSETDSLVWALNHYKEGTCQQIADYFGRSGTDMQIKPLRIFYQALCYLDQKQYEQAFGILTTLCEIEAFEFHAEACWYAALTASEMRHYSHIAREHLFKVSKDAKSPYQKKANEILNPSK